MSAWFLLSSFIVLDEWVYCTFHF